jgi:hypothetical protein
MLAAVIACQINRLAAAALAPELRVTNGSTIHSTAEGHHILTARPQRSMAAQPEAIRCLRDKQMRARTRLSVEAGNRQESVTAVPEGADSRVPATVPPAAEARVTGVQEWATEVRIVVAVVATAWAIAASPLAVGLVAPAPLAAALEGSAEAARGPAARGDPPAWAAAAAVVVAGDGGNTCEEGEIHESRIV